MLDVLVRPVEAIPEGQGGELVEEIRITAAGSAGGTALVLAKLGAQVKSAGAIGRDAAGDMLLALLERDGVDTELLVRRDDVQTSASVLPIRPSGERPAFHVVGANGSFGPDDVPPAEIEATTHLHLHLGGPEFMGGEAAAPLLARAREHGVVTSADVLAPGEPGLLEWIAPALPELDYLLPNREQVLTLTGTDELEEGCRALLERGVGCLAVTCGAEGVVLVDAEGSERFACLRSAARRRHSWPRVSAPTTASSTSPRSSSSPPRPTSQLARRPQGRGQEDRGHPDHQPDDPAGHVLAHEHRAERDGDADDAAGRDQAHGSALQLRTAPLSGRHHSLRALAPPSLALALAILARRKLGFVLGHVRQST